MHARIEAPVEGDSVQCASLIAPYALMLSRSTSRLPDDGTKHRVNHVESFWNLFKNSVRTHIHISPRYTDRYLREFTFPANHREMQNAMFDLLIRMLTAVSNSARFAGATHLASSCRINSLKPAVSKAFLNDNRSSSLERFCPRCIHAAQHEQRGTAHAGARRHR
jgi:hypothetical protein